MIKEVDGIEHRIWLKDLGYKAEKLGLINWRQIERVKRGQSVNVRGASMFPNALEALIKEIEADGQA